MPKFLEKKLKKQYGNNPTAIYGTMNKIGAMKGNKETVKGRAMQKKHNKDIKKSKSNNPKSYLAVKKSLSKTMGYK